MGESFFFKLHQCAGMGHDSQIDRIPVRQPSPKFLFYSVRSLRRLNQAKIAQRPRSGGE